MYSNHEFWCSWQQSLHGFGALGIPCDLGFLVAASSEFMSWELFSAWGGRRLGATMNCAGLWRSKLLLINVCVIIGTITHTRQSPCPWVSVLRASLIWWNVTAACTSRNSQVSVTVLYALFFPSPSQQKSKLFTHLIVGRGKMGSVFACPSPGRLCCVFSERLRCPRSKESPGWACKSLLPKEAVVGRWVNVWGDQGLMCLKAKHLSTGLPRILYKRLAWILLSHQQDRIMVLSSSPLHSVSQLLL